MNFLNCSELDLISYCYNNINVKGNNPNTDRKASNFVVDTLLNMQQEHNITLDAPVRVLWKITGKCNCNCEHCWAKLGTEPDKDSLIKVAKEIADNNIFMVSLSGGEPFLNQYIFEIIEILKSKNIIVEIMTNGSLIDKETAQKLKFYLDCSTDAVQVSLDGSKSEIHDKQRNKPIFNQTIKGIENLVSQGVHVRNVFVATPINEDDMVDTYKLSASLGSSVFAPVPVFPFRKGKKFEHLIDSEKYIRQVGICKSLENSLKTKLRIQVDQYYQFLLNKYVSNLDLSIFKPNYPIKYSYLPNECNSTFQIDAQGEAVPGPEYDKNFSAGNVYKESLMNIWRKGENWEMFRQGRDLSNTKCRQCKIYDVCLGGNMKLAYDKNGAINFPDGTCIVNI